MTKSRGSQDGDVSGRDQEHERRRMAGTLPCPLAYAYYCTAPPAAPEKPPRGHAVETWRLDHMCAVVPGAHL